jgi:hypothetical protein
MSILSGTLDGLHFDEGTILFVDRPCAQALACLVSFSSLVPSPLTMICSIEGDLSPLLVNLANSFDFHSIAVLISRPISSFANQIKQLSEPGYPITPVYTLFPGDSPTSVSRFLFPGSFKSFHQLLIPLAAQTYLVPTLSLSLFDPAAKPDPSLIDRCIRDVLNQLRTPPAKFFAFGDLPKLIAQRTRDDEPSDPECGVLIVDRRQCCTPLFVHFGSYLDDAVCQNFVSVVKDRALIEADLRNNLLGAISSIFGLDPASKYDKLRAHWSSLSEAQKAELEKRNPALPFVFGRLHAAISQREMELLDCDPPGEYLQCILDGDPHKPSLACFAHCFGRGNVAECVSDQRVLRVLKMCSSGVTVEANRTPSLSQLHLLPRLVQSVVDPNTPLDARLQTAASGLLGMVFGQTKSIKDCREIVVVVLGGVSFFELREIAKLNAERLTVVSDRICSMCQVFDAP